MAIKDALATQWTTAHPTWSATLMVAANYNPTVGSPTLLVADDGGPRVVGDAWSVGLTPTRPLIRLTAYAKGREEALECVDAAVDHILANRPSEIARFENASHPVVTRDRATGAFLAYRSLPAVVRQPA